MSSNIWIYENLNFKICQLYVELIFSEIQSIKFWLEIFFAYFYLEITFLHTDTSFVFLIKLTNFILKLDLLEIEIILFLLFGLFSRSLLDSIVKSSNYLKINKITCQNLFPLFSLVTITVFKPWLLKQQQVNSITLTECSV